MTTYGQRIKKYMDEIGWTVVDLSRKTLIHFVELEAIINDGQLPTENQLMIIVNKINLQYPKSRHWEIFHDITFHEILKGE
jgi:hypothetical protein